MALTVQKVPLARLFAVASIDEESGKPQVRTRTRGNCTSLGVPVSYTHASSLCLRHRREQGSWS